MAFYVSKSDYEKASREVLKEGYIRSEIESGTEAPDVLMPNSVLARLTSAYKQSPPTTEKPKIPSVTADDVEQDLVGASKRMAREYQNTPQAKAAKAQKDYDDYLKSDSYNQKKAERTKKYQLDQLTASVLDGYTPKMEDDPEELRLRAAKENAEKEYKDAEDAAVMQRDMNEIQKMTPEERRQLEEFATGVDVDFFNSLNFAQNGMQIGRAEDRAMGLIQKYGEQRVNEMANTLRRYQNAQTTAEVEQKARESVTGGFWNGVGQSLKTVPASAVGGATGALGFLRELTRGDDRYQSLDPNALDNIGNVYSGAVRGEVAQNIEGDVYDENGEMVKDGGKLRSLGAIAYQGVMSMADTIARGYLGGGALGGAALAATGSFSQTMADAARQGASPAQAALLATATAGIEALTEKLPLDELIKTAGGKGGASVIKNIARQAGIEIMEEEASLLGTLLAEAAILQEKSSYNQNVTAKILLGQSPEEARSEASMDIFWEAVNTALVSGVAGLGGGISAEGMNRMNQLKAEAAGNQNKTAAQARAEELAYKAAQMSKSDAQKAQEAIEATVPPQVQTASQTVSSPVVEAQQIPAQAAAPETTKPVVPAPAPETEKQFAESDYHDEFENWGSNKPTVKNDPFAGRDYNEVSKRSVKAYMYENPEVKPYFQMEAYNLLRELGDTTRGETFYNADVAYESGGEKGFTGTKRHTSDGIEELLDNGFTYDQIEKGLQAIIEDNGAENNAASKKIEFLLHDRLVNGHKDFYGETDVYPDGRVPASEEYVNLINEKQIHTYDRSPALSTPTTDTQNQSTEGGLKIKGTGAAEQNFTGTAAYDDLLSDDNVQRTRKGDSRDIEVPKTDADGRTVSEFVGNSMNSALTPERFTDTIKKLVVDGKVSHDIQSNEESLRSAAAEIAKDGTIYRSVQKVAEVAQSGKTSVTDVAKAELLYNHLVQQEDQQSQEMAADVYVTLAQLATNSGRSTQMFSIFRKMTPDGQVMAMEQEVKRNVDKLKKQGKVSKDYSPEINPELLAEYRKAAVENKKASTPEKQQETMEQMSLWQDAIYAAEAAKMPSTFKAKWDAWRYMAMLGNAKTQVRNVVGNLAFKPYKAVKDAMAAGAERIFVKQDQRTKSVLTLSAEDRALTSWAKADTKSKAVQDALKYSAKLGDDVSSSVMAENQTVFNNKTLEAARKFIEKVPQHGDMLFKNGYYEKSLAGFIKARGYSAADIQSGKVSDAVLNEGRAYAIQEAMKATFNDCNAFSDAVASIGRSNKDNAWSKIFNIAAEGVLPFRRTPANIMVRFTEYSPVGLAKGVWDAATKIRNGDISAAAAVDQLAAGMTGTAVMALGFMLAKGICGVKITGSGTDEDEKRQGHQDYAVEFSVDGEEYSYKIDWAAPANLPLFVGANIYQALEGSSADTDVSKLTSFIHGIGTMFEPMLALSCMSSLNDLVEGARYAEEGEALYSMAASIATSYFTQGIPALARQAAQALQENKQTTFANNDDPTMRDLQKAAANVPFAGAPFQTDKVNAWGEKETEDNWLVRTANAFANPGTLKKIDNSAVEQEISRLNKAGQNVTPNTASKTISYIDKDGNGHDEVRLTEQQYQTLAQTQGQTARKLLEDMFESKDYAAMSDELKAEAIDAAYLYARKTGEIAVIEDHTGYDQTWMLDVKSKGANEILRRVMNSDLNTSMSDLDAAWDKGYNEENFNRNLQTAYDTYSNASPAMRRQVYAEAEGTTKKYIEARDKGLTHQKAVAAIENVAKTKGTGSNGTVRDIDRRRAIANTTGLSEKEIDVVMKAYMADYDSKDESPETTELKYRYVREELDLSPKEYTETYRAYLDGDKKTQKIATIQAMGYDYGTACKLYKVYAGSLKNKLIDMYG